MTLWRQSNSIFNGFVDVNSMLDLKAAVHLHEDDLELYLCGRLEPERMVPVERHLLECNICRIHLSSCLGQNLALQLLSRSETHITQKRTEPRFGTEGEGTLQELHPLS